MPNPQATAAVWHEQKAYLKDGTAQAWFGSWVAISGSFALIGAKNTTVGGHASQGAIYVFRKSATSGVWTLTQTLVASDGAAGDQFGSSIALSGDTAIITAPFARIDGRIWQGAAYVFSLVGKTWTQKHKLVAAHGVANETFGTAVAINASSAFIGAGGASQGGHVIPRSVYVFSRVPSHTGDVWAEKQNLPTPDPADATSSFGASIAATDAVALVGARASTVGDQLGQGLVYAYTPSNGVWNLTAKLVADDGAARDNFGVSIAIDGTTALIGSPGDTIEGHVSQGAVYEFQLSAGTWRQTQKFVAKDGTARNLFGASVSKWQGRALVGAYAADDYRGAAYVFDFVAGAWTQVHKLVASDGVSGDVYGYYTALDATTALVGAYDAMIGANAKQGAVYFYTESHLGTQPPPHP